MTKPLKRSDQDKAWARGTRKIGERSYQGMPERQRFLIVCEGEKTEPYYFEALKATLKRGVVEVKVLGVGTNTLNLVERAVQEKSRVGTTGEARFDQVWVVFDRDDFPAPDFDNAIKKASANGVRCAWSNQAFELWYVLHFDDRSNRMQREDYQQCLSRHLKTEYLKSDAKMYHRLQALGSQAKAIERAAALETRRGETGSPPSKANPCTLVYQLVEELAQFRDHSLTQ